MPSLRKLLCETCFCLLLIFGSLPAIAAEAPVVAPPAPTNPSAPPAAAKAPVPASLVGSMVLETGTGKAITLSGSAANVFVADPKVAEVRPASANSLFIFGVSPGHTTVAAMDAGGHVLAEYNLTVQPSSFAADSAQSMIARLMPDSHVRVLAQDKGLILSGTVTSVQDAAQAVAIAKDFSNDPTKVDNEISVAEPLQVTLSVRIAEMSREVVRKLGINWAMLAQFGQIGRLGSQLTYSSTTTGIVPPATCPNCPGVGFLGVIDALANDNLAQVLAEPNLTVMSGQTASFQVGGQYPIPVTSGTNNQITVTYQNFGVLLSFVPTVMSDGRINLHVKPEVSEISAQNSIEVTSGGIALNIPGLAVRRAETTVELGSGESFAIAGLLQQQTSDSGSGVAGLSDVPVLGSLFHDDQFDRTETELVIIVTPYIVRPVKTLADLHLPTDTYSPPTDIQRLLFMRQTATNEPPVPIRIPGDAGFMVQ